MRLQSYIVGLAMTFAGCAGEELSVTEESLTVYDLNVVTDWNNTALNTVRADAVVNRQTRDMAMVQGAMFDAMNAIRAQYTPALVSVEGPGYASREAAGAQAAHDVLVALFPAQRAALDAQLATSLSHIPDDRPNGNQPKAAGIVVGQQVAAAVLLLRANDHAFDTKVFVQPPAGPGVYQLTPGCTAANMSVPHWGTVTPFTAATPTLEQHPPVDSQEWLDSLAEVRAYGAVNSSVRSLEQTQIALFWLEPSLPSMNRLARAMILAEAAQGNPGQAQQQLLEHARLFAALNIAEADTYIYTWKVKYDQLFWRPFTAINTTFPGTNWVPLRQTPCHPEYYAAHGTLTAAGTGALQNYFGDAIDVDATSTTLVGVTRHYTSFDGMLDEVNRARIYAGFHYRSTLVRSNVMGRYISSFVDTEIMQPLD